MQDRPVSLRMRISPWWNALRVLCVHACSWASGRAYGVFTCTCRPFNFYLDDAVFLAQIEGADRACAVG